MLAGIERCFLTLLLEEGVIIYPKFYYFNFSYIIHSRRLRGVN